MNNNSSSSSSSEDECKVHTGACPCRLRDCKCNHHELEIQNQKPSTLPRLADTWLTKNKITIKRKLISPVGIIATVDKNIPENMLVYLLKNEVNILHIHLALATRTELDAVMLKITTAIDNYYLKSPKLHNQISVAMEMRGRVVRVGRLRNEASVKLKKTTKVLLTSNKAYAQCSTANIIYLTNFDPYFGVLKIGDYIFINKHKIQLVVVKITRTFQTITCCILRGSLLQSYMEATLPYLIEQDVKMTDEEIEDCKFADVHNADFIIIPSVTDHIYVQCVRKQIMKEQRQERPMILASINLSAFENIEHLDLVINEIEGTWIDNIFTDKMDYEQLLILKSREQFKPVVWKMCKIENKEVIFF